MPRGSNVPKGTRIGGRQRGTPNKATTERLEAERIARQAQDEVNKANVAKIKLAKDVLEDYVGAFHAIAALYQNKIAQAAQAGRPPDPKDLAAFEKWGGLTAKTAKDLADFQSPKFKAISVMAPSPTANLPAANGNVIDMKDAVALTKNYQKLIKQVVGT